MGLTTLKLNPGRQTSRSPSAVGLPASAFPNRAAAYFCDNCQRDMTKHLHPGRAHVWQAMGPSRYICRCGQEWPTGALEWDQFSAVERQRRLRDTFVFSI